MNIETFKDLFNVSRETLSDLRVYEELLLKWAKKTNLVSKKALKDIWQRHFIDSGQLLNHIDFIGNRWVDIGSGAGFPGLLVKVIMRDRGIECDVVLVEKNKKKVFFLNEVRRRLGLDISIIDKDYEKINPLQADVLSARAVTDLNELLGIAHVHCKNEAVCLFLKGKNFKTELDKSFKNWIFDYDVFNSLSSCSGKIIRVKNIYKI
ncbi:16S rRNA (guanine(527)-N(7))-methyltransferase RsmG [Paracoccaceae bacterium]|nr:16S rRNA (guanine(527)-N(7))-methyltransferase RsmG [Paracoccaceae bacterium]